MAGICHTHSQLKMRDINWMLCGYRKHFELLGERTNKHKSNRKNIQKDGFVDSLGSAQKPASFWHWKSGQWIPPHPGILASRSLQRPGLNADLDNGSLLPPTGPGRLISLYSNKSPPAPGTAATHCFFKGLNKTLLILLAWGPAAAGQVLWRV